MEETKGQGTITTRFVQSTAFGRGHWCACGQRALHRCRMASDAGCATDCPKKPITICGAWACVPGLLGAASFNHRWPLCTHTGESWNYTASCQGQSHGALAKALSCRLFYMVSLASFSRHFLGNSGHEFGWSEDVERFGLWAFAFGSVLKEWSSKQPRVRASSYYKKWTSISISQWELYAKGTWCTCVCKLQAWWIMKACDNQIDSSHAAESSMEACRSLGVVRWVCRMFHGRSMGVPWCSVGHIARELYGQCRRKEPRDDDFWSWCSYLASRSAGSNWNANDINDFCVCVSLSLSLSLALSPSLSPSLSLSLALSLSLSPSLTLYKANQCKPWNLGGSCHILFQTNLGVSHCCVEAASKWGDKYISVEHLVFAFCKAWIWTWIVCRLDGRLHVMHVALWVLAD